MPIFAHGFSVADLYRREGLIRLDQIFLSQLAEADPQLHQQLCKPAAILPTSPAPPPATWPCGSRHSSRHS